jgi:propionyl-CoA carboxylase alpha chain
VDAGVEQGSEIFLFYDSMIAKLSAWAPTRAEAIARMERALAEYQIAGVHTTIPFCRFVVGHERFKAGQYSTHFIDEHFRPEVLRNEEAEGFAALAAALYYDRNATAPAVAAPAPAESRWVLRRLNR